MQLVPRLPHVGYISDRLWVPKVRVNAHTLRWRVTFTRSDGQMFKNFEENTTHLLLPREFPRTDFGDIEFIDVRPDTYPVVPWSCLAQSRTPQDEAGWEALQTFANGLFVLRCGGGKTVQALRRIALSQAPALVVVHTTQLLGQWLERAVEWLRLEGRILLADRDIGIVQGSTQQWDRPLVFAMVQTLCNKMPPSKLRRQFKTVVYDEAHHLAATQWSKAASFGFGDRIGLTATPNRKAEEHRIFEQHLGGIFYEDTRQEWIPKCFFLHGRTNVTTTQTNVRDVMGELSFGKLWTVLGKETTRNEKLLCEIEGAARSGRKILVLSASVEHCQLLFEESVRRFPAFASGLCIGEVSVEDRLRSLRECRVIYATLPLAKEGLDQKDLDTVFIATPLRDENMLKQIVGRIQRPFGMSPIVLVMLDTNLSPCVSLCAEMRKNLIKWGFPVFDKKENA